MSSFCDLFDDVIRKHGPIKAMRNVKMPPITREAAKGSIEQMFATAGKDDTNLFRRIVQPTKDEMYNDMINSLQEQYG
jgi:hypothetical protein